MRETNLLVSDATILHLHPPCDIARMNQRGFPLWLLRDVRTLVTVMLSFWPLVIFVITNGAKAVRGAAGPRNTISLLLAHAEAWLDYAFMRQAYRLCGFDPRAVTLHIIPPTTRWADTVERFRNYGLAFRNMNRVTLIIQLQVQHRYGGFLLRSWRAAPGGWWDGFQITSAAVCGVVAVCCLRAWSGRDKLTGH